MIPEQTYLTKLVREAFNHIEWYDTIGYKSGFLSGEMMADDVAKEAGERNYRLFRDSELYKIANDVLTYYVLSPQFKQDLRQDYFQEELERGEKVPDLPLDGSAEISIDTITKVRGYLIEVSRLGGLFEYNEPFREWFSRQFLHTLDDRNEYVRGSFQRMLHQSTGRRVTFDEALGYEIRDFSADPAADNPSSVIGGTLDALKSMVCGEDKIKDRKSYDVVVSKIKESPLYATLFSHPVVLFSAYQAAVHEEGSIHALRLQHFLNLVESNGIINSFEHSVPYPALDKIMFPELVFPLEYTKSLYDALYCASMKEPFYLQPLPSPRDSDPLFPNQRMEDRAWLEVSGAMKRMRWTDDEKKLFSRKAINHLCNDPKAYTLFEKVGFGYPEAWPAVVEELAVTKKPVLELLVEEIKSGSPLRKGTVLGKSSDVYTSGEFVRHVTIDNAVYRLEVERSLVVIINALCDREVKINDWCGDGSREVADYLSDMQHQFMSVSRLNGTQRDRLSTVWLQHSEKEPAELHYYDEMDVGTGEHEELKPIRDTLRKLVDEFARECGYNEVIFDPDGLIEGMNK